MAEEGVAAVAGGGEAAGSADRWDGAAPPLGSTSSRVPVLARSSNGGIAALPPPLPPQKVLAFTRMWNGPLAEVAGHQRWRRRLQPSEIEVGVEFMASLNRALLDLAISSTTKV